VQDFVVSLHKLALDPTFLRTLRAANSIKNYQFHAGIHHNGPNQPFFAMPVI
jgi:hypothetical protein